MATGYVLPAESTSVEALQVFPGFPGRFMPGQPLSLHHMGIEEEEADRLIEEQGLPLQKVSMSEADATAPIDRGDNFAPSSYESEGLPVEVVEEKLVELKHDELDALAAEHGVELPSGLNKTEKAEFLAEAGVMPPEEEEA